MYKPCTYLIMPYFPTYLPRYETYFLQNWSPRWNQILIQLWFIHNWIIMGIPWVVQWWVLVHFGPCCKTFIIPATSFQIFNYFSFFLSNSNNKNFRHFQRVECWLEINEMTRPLLQSTYIISLVCPVVVVLFIHPSRHPSIQAFHPGRRRWWRGGGRMAVAAN